MLLGARRGNRISLAATKIVQVAYRISRAEFALPFDPLDVMSRGAPNARFHLR